MKKYLISLQKDVQRRELFFSQPDTADFILFDAINTMNMDWADLESRFDVASFQRHYGRAVTKGEIGCTLSHLGVYEWVVKDDSITENDYVLICEDDALFAKNFHHNLTALLQQQPTADILLVGQSKILAFDDKELELNYPTTFAFKQRKIGDTQYSYAYPYKNYFAGTVAYLIKKSACRVFVEKMQSTLIHWLADDYILFGNAFHLDVMVVRPLMVIENPNLISNLENIRGSIYHQHWKKLLKYPLKKLLAIKRNL